MSWVNTILNRLWNKTHGQPAATAPPQVQNVAEQKFEQFLNEHEDRYHPRHAKFGPYQLKGPDGVGYYYETINGIRIDVMPDKGAGTWAVYANGKSIGMTNTREVVESLIEEALTAPPEA